MKELYEAVKNELSRLDFEAIWPGFEPIPFALVGGDQVYLDAREIPLGDGFWANTVVEYEGGLLATWCVDNPEDEDVQMLASNIVHEMFHGFQNTVCKKDGASEFALMSYPDDLTAYRIKAAEIRLLARAYTEGDPAALADFVSLRKSRALLLGDVIKDEYLIEEEEGTAEYAGLCALMQLNPEKFEKYVKENHIGKLTNPGEELFSVRVMSYFTGAVLCLALKKMGVGFYHCLSASCSLFEVISDKDIIADDFEKYYAIKKAKFDDFLSTNTTVIEKSAKITGFDPMNMWRMGDHIFCARFISLDGESMPGPVMLNMVPGSEREVVSIILSQS